MRLRRRLQILLLCGATLLLRVPANAAESKELRAEASPPAFTTEQLVGRVRPSLVTLSTRGRDGAKEGVGTGFVIDPTGLIATSLHVVGESRPISARLASGEELEVISIHAFDRHADLAILRVAATNLPALPLGDSSRLAVGAEVVAFGNPLGLENSVVAGVLSGRRSFDEIEMLQVAIPIEPGNSGGPLLDRAGRVNGLVNAKSLLTRNLGFATPVNLLKPLLERPNPVPLARWVRTGALDSTRWESHLGANWRQRAGRIQVEGVGSGFGGRSYIVQRAEAPEPPYEVTVTVRLQDEAGAAGLIFGGDEQGRHYGFYPTGGQLRLTAFEGPEVFSWRILGTVPSPAYRSGDWNVLRVRQDSGRIQCWVNGSEVFSVAESALAGRRVGLTKFRNTSAEFRDFVCATSLESGTSLAENLANALGGASPAPAPLTPEQLAALRRQLPAARAFLAARAQNLEREATRLRELGQQLHRDQVRDDLVAELNQAEEKIDLARAALLVARLDQPDLDLTAYRQQLRDLGDELRSRLGASLSDAERVELLRKFLFEENGFHGSRHDYYNRANSYLNEVLDDREGLPITLSFVFLSVGEQAGIPDLHGVPLPGHFLVKYAPTGGDERLIDVFDGGRYLTHSEADELGSSAARLPVRSEFIRPATKREMIVRLLGNLQSFTERDESPAASLPYSDLLVAVAGDARSEAAQRIDRARLRSRTGDLVGARADLQWIVDTSPPGFVQEQLQEMIERLEAAGR
ncbi:MAG: trypsin-like peptidase domain-containing protein [Verrucomicrobia bacterium]|nr:trypsin-like peptidase domain-containing protein [Verrucomicrobiota bacterium]